MENKAPAVLNAVPPYGHVIASEKWRNSSLIQSLKGGGVKILFENELGVADFHLPNKSCILYVSECDIVAGNGYKRKLVRYRNSKIIAMRSFPRIVQPWFTLLSDADCPTCSDGLQVHGEDRENPFRRRSSSRLLDPLVLAMVQHVPGVGRVKALALLQQFSSIQELCNAPPAELEPIVGQAAAQQIHSFFHKPTTAGN
ncbi:Fanconi anemia core complex-associated protein 24 [Perca fluviatilis]|uniref:Fanconi anemia core complex-associated protein 24 n=1 Tax=Perca fluviatilis TaxID=8168 RepID=UPI0019655CC4|nr:Fanconi anemia core complex-associated protein 24 [Perca fluviatilis]